MPDGSAFQKALPAKRKLNYTFLLIAYTDHTKQRRLLP